MAVMRYFERRGRIHQIETHVVADIMRHFHARQHLGKAVVICDKPEELVELAQRQWLKLARTLQRRRQMSFRADEILRHTYTITHMQQLRLAAGPIDALLDKDIYFARTDQVTLLPANCLTLYCATALDEARMSRLVEWLPASAMVVDYSGVIQTGDYGLRPKIELESRVAAQWRNVEAFLAERQIVLPQPDQEGTELFDDVLDVLLAYRAEFIQLAVAFQYILNLARPLRTITKAERTLYDNLLTMAHHVQTLTPGILPAQFLKTYADDSFFLNDRHGLHRPVSQELIARHLQAGRIHLAQALMALGGYSVTAEIPILACV